LVGVKALRTPVRAVYVAVVASEVVAVVRGEEDFDAGGVELCHQVVEGLEGVVVVLAEGGFDVGYLVARAAFDTAAGKTSYCVLFVVSGDVLVVGGEGLTPETNDFCTDIRELLDVGGLYVGVEGMDVVVVGTAERVGSGC
jgi:hypothetical protein